VEGERWLALGERGNGRLPISKFILCDQAPSNLAVYANPQDACEEAVGSIRRVVGEYDYDILFPDGRFQQPRLISLALTFLIHQIP
jgi:hypothetical protein